MNSNDSLRVGILRHTLFLPSETFIPLQVRHLPRCNAYFYCRDTVQGVADELKVIQFTPSRVGRLRYMLLRSANELTRALKADDVNIVHAHFGPEGFYARRAALNAGIPLVVTLHGYETSLSTRQLLLSRKPAWVYWAMCRRKFMRNADIHFIAVSQEVARDAVALGASRARISVISTGVDTQSILPTAYPRSKVVVHVGRLVEKKGTADLIRAFAAVLEMHPESVLRIIGSGPLDANLRELAEVLKVGSSVRFLGALTSKEVLREIDGAAVLVAPSVTASTGDKEGLPQVILEAGALARPVVATRHSGIPEAIEHGKTGLLVPEHSPDQLASGISELLSDPPRAANLGLAARRKVVSQFDVGVQSAKVRGLYDVALMSARASRV